MRFLIKKLRHPYVWRRVFLERLTEPLHLNLLSAFVALFGSFRARVAFDLVVRQQHAFGLLTAADKARLCGIDELTVVEFGVASGAGLLNLCEVGRKVTRATGVRFNVIGFDTGAGMPEPRDYRDHPEYYAAGDFPVDRAALARKLPPNARVIYGEIERTLPEFLDSQTRLAPVGFVSVDVDYYSSTSAALRLFEDPDPLKYLPWVVIYLDDVMFDGHNEWCGELLAVSEFSRTHPVRKIGKFNFLRNTRVFRNPAWIDHMHMLHVLDHPFRQPGARPPGPPAVLRNPYL
jgi:hypothetical protein